MKWELELELETLNYANCSFIRCLRFGLEMFACIYSSEKRVCPPPAAAPLSERDCVAWHGLCLFYDTETDLRYATGICMGPIMKMSWWGAPPPAPCPRPTKERNKRKSWCYYYTTFGLWYVTVSRTSGFLCEWVCVCVYGGCVRELVRGEW